MKIAMFIAGEKIRKNILLQKGRGLFMETEFAKSIQNNKIWLLAVIIAIEIVNVQILEDMIGSGISAIISIVLSIIVLILARYWLGRKFNIIQGRYAIDKQKINERIDEIASIQSDVVVEQEKKLADFEKYIGERSASIGKEIINS
ncbi:MAG: hypothetical protein IJU00_01115, partial [Selenomonas sp.]|nr:hypothetical protein [Selenomonas sp.]